MRVVDTRDFCLPSDENDYDELVAFADTMASIPQFDAVPIDVLDQIRAEIEHEREETYKMLGCELGFDKIAAYDKCIGFIDQYKAESEETEPNLTFSGGKV